MFRSMCRAVNAVSLKLRIAQNGYVMIKMVVFLSRVRLIDMIEIYFTRFVYTYCCRSLLPIPTC